MEQGKIVVGRRGRTRRALLGLAFVLIGCGCAVAGGLLEMANGYGAREGPRDITPEGLGAAFCAGRQSGDMRTILAHLAPKLARLLAEVANPETVPWQRFPDRPETCEVSIVNGYDDTVGVLVKMTYVAGGKSWSDTLNLERTPTSWWLNNVFYDGGGNLRFRLAGG